MIQQYTSWLCNDATRENCDPLKGGSILDILSATRSLFNKTFPTNSIFSGQVEQLWYTKLRAKSKEEVTRREIRRGVASSNKSKPIGREQVKGVVDTLLKTNTPSSVRKAVYVATTFNTAGRSGEAAFSVIDSGTYWDYDDQKLYFNQKENKVGGEKSNNFVSDSKHYELDQYWIFFVYYLLGGGSSFVKPSNQNAHFIFPELYDKETGSKGAASAFVTSILKDLMPTDANSGKVIIAFKTPECDACSKP